MNYKGTLATSQSTQLSICVCLWASTVESASRLWRSGMARVDLPGICRGKCRAQWAVCVAVVDLVQTAAL
jgi:hypothetical protein